MQLKPHQFILIKSSNLKEHVDDLFCDFLNNVYREDDNVVLTFNLELLDSDLKTMLLKDQTFFESITKLENKAKQVVNNDEKICMASFKIESKKLPAIIEAERFINEKGQISFPYSDEVERNMNIVKQTFDNQKKDLELQISNIDLAMEELDKQVENLIKLNEEAKKVQKEIDKLNV